MKKNNRLGAPINFFTKMDYEEYHDPILGQDFESNMGETNEEIHYHCYNLKNGEEMKGIAYHNTPYFPASIPAVLDSVNVITRDKGSFEIDPTVSHEECLSAIKELIDAGVPINYINSDMVKERMQEKAIQKVA